MIRTSSSHTRANTTNIFLVGTKKYTAPFPYPGFPCKPHGLLPTGSNFYLSRNTRSYALLPEYSEPCFFCNDHSARSRAFSRRTRDHAPSPRRSDRAFPEALGPYFFPKHSDRAFSRRTRDRAPFPKRSEPRFFCNDHSARSRAFSVTITLLGAALFPDGLGSCFFPTDSGSYFFCYYHSALNATRHKTRIFYLNTKLRLSQTAAVI